LEPVIAADARAVTPEPEMYSTVPVDAVKVPARVNGVPDPVRVKVFEPLDESV
jgi:hypothetical protein